MPFSIRLHHRLSLTYLSGFCLLITLLVLNSPAYADWVVVSENGEVGITVYVDPDTIRRKKDLVRMWTLTDYKTVQITESGSYLSSRTQQQIDCAEERAGWREFRLNASDRHAGRVCGLSEGGDHLAYRWIDKTYNIVQRTEMPKGGHFADLEQPDLLIKDIRTFFKLTRD